MMDRSDNTSHHELSSFILYLFILSVCVLGGGGGMGGMPISPECSGMSATSLDLGSRGRGIILRCRFNLNIMRKEMINFQMRLNKLGLLLVKTTGFITLVYTHTL